MASKRPDRCLSQFSSLSLSLSILTLAPTTTFPSKEDRSTGLRLEGPSAGTKALEAGAAGAAEATAAAGERQRTATVVDETRRVDDDAAREHAAQRRAWRVVACMLMMLFAS